MTYTFLSARYANSEKTVAFAQTDGFGEVLVSEADAPDLWGELIESEVAIAPFQALPPPAEPDPVDKLAEFLNANPDVKALVMDGEPLASILATAD
jgi:hypothetical protein